MLAHVTLLIETVMLPNLGRLSLRTAPVTVSAPSKRSNVPIKDEYEEVSEALDLILVYKRTATTKEEFFERYYNIMRWIEIVQAYRIKYNEKRFRASILIEALTSLRNNATLLKLEGYASHLDEMIADQEWLKSRELSSASFKELLEERKRIRGSGGSVLSNPLFDAIEARRAEKEILMRLIERGEITVEDPRERRLRELKEQEQAATDPSKDEDVQVEGGWEIELQDVVPDDWEAAADAQDEAYERAKADTEQRLRNIYGNEPSSPSPSDAGSSSSDWEWRFEEAKLVAEKKLKDAKASLEAEKAESEKRLEACEAACAVASANAAEKLEKLKNNLEMEKGLRADAATQARLAAKTQREKAEKELGEVKETLDARKARYEKERAKYEEECAKGSAKAAEQLEKATAALQLQKDAVAQARDLSKAQKQELEKANGDLKRARDEMKAQKEKLSATEKKLKAVTDELAAIKKTVAEAEAKAKAKAKAEAEAKAKAEAEAKKKVQATLVAQLRIKAIRKRVKEAQEAAMKDQKGVLVQQYRGPPIEPIKHQVVLRRSNVARWRAINMLFSNVSPSALEYFGQKGRDQQEKGAYNALVPVGVFDIYYGPKNARKAIYLAHRTWMSIGEQCKEYGTNLECVRTDKALASVAKDADFPELDTGINEKLLVHGTTVNNLPLILGGGFDRRYNNQAAYGYANYQAEDPGKADQYVVSTNYEAFNERLGIDVSQYDNKKTFYMLVSRTLLGCANHVKNGTGNMDQTTDLQGKRVYDDKKLFRMPYDSVIVEYASSLRGSFADKHYREFLVQNDERILPVMLVAYVRDTRQRTFDPKVLGC